MLRQYFFRETINKRTIIILKQIMMAQIDFEFSLFDPFFTFVSSATINNLLLC